MLCLLKVFLNINFFHRFSEWTSSCLHSLWLWLPVCHRSSNVGHGHLQARHHDCPAEQTDRGRRRILQGQSLSQYKTKIDDIVDRYIFTPTCLIHPLSFLPWNPNAFLPTYRSFLWALFYLHPVLPSYPTCFFSVLPAYIHTYLTWSSFHLFFLLPR